MENRVRIKLISSTIVALLLFTVVIAVSPPALAEKGQVLFTDIAGTPVKLWRVGETIYITVFDPDENRSSDEVDLIGADEWWFNEDQLGNKNPVIEVCDPNTGDCESSRPEGVQLVLQETGVNTGAFRSKFGILIGKSIIGTSPIPNDGVLEVQDNDTIYARYIDPTDDTDIDVDLAKIDRTRAIIKITDGAGNEIDLLHAGRDAVFVTVEDPDENIDPVKVDIIKDVVLERPRPNQDGTIEREVLTLVETGPNTGIFRNPNNVLLVDDVILTPDNDLRLAVRDKDTIIVYYRSPAVVPVVPPVRIRTDCHPDESIIKFCRTVPVSVEPGDTFEVKVEITARVNLELAAFSDTLPPGFTLVSGSLTAFQADMGAGTTLTASYQVRAGANIGTFNITGTARAKPVGLPSRTFVLTSPVEVIEVAEPLPAAWAWPLKVDRTENTFIIFSREVPDRVNPGETFTVTVKITAKVDLELAAVSDTLSAAFTLVSGSLTAFRHNMRAGEVLTNTYQVRASEIPPPLPHTISGIARSKPPAQPSKILTLDSYITIGVVPVPVLVGLGDANDPRDFDLDVAKIAEPNPGEVTFTDITGREKPEFKIGEDLFIKVEDEDLNIDSDRVERVTVRVYNIRGSIEEVELIETGVNSSTFMNTKFVKIEGGDPKDDRPDDGRIIVGNDDVIYVHFVDDPERCYDAYDVDFTTAKIFDSQVFSPPVNNIRFTDDRGNPVPSYKKGMDAFVEVNDPDQNISSNLVDTFTIIVLDKNTGDREEVMVEETGPNTGIFRSREGIPLRRLPKAVHNDGILQVEDRDVIEAHYHDAGNPADFSAAKINIIPVPVWVPTPSRTSFVDAVGRDVTEYEVGDNVFVKVTDPDENRTRGVPDVIKDALTVENVVTGQTIKVDLTETGPDTGVFMTAAITTSVGQMLQVEDGHILRAEYVDPNDPTDRSSDTANVVTVELKVIAWKNVPNPFSVSTTFQAIGTGILRVKVQVYDLTGRLVFEKEAAGSKIVWDGTDMTGARLPNGVYLYIMTATGRKNMTVTSPVMKLVIAR